MCRVLVLDDDELFGRTLADRLEREPAIKLKVTAVRTADEARRTVEQATSPFDVFLIDQRLGPGPDGIAVMEDLRRLSPDSDAVIFTVVDDPDTVRRAFEAGVYRYLPKPFDTPQLVLILISLYEQRRVQRERNSLCILAEIAAETQRGLTVREVAASLLTGGLKLGFERGRLWRLSEDGKEWVGLSQQGCAGLEGFEGLRVPVEDLAYPYHALTRGETAFFHGAELGPDLLPQDLGPQGFCSPMGEWVELLLTAGDRCIGALALDNARKPCDLRSEERDLLRLFGNQAAAALARAWLYEQEMRSRQELTILNEIGRQITSHAALDDLDTLLREVRTQVGMLMDVRDFMIVLLDEETGQLDFRFHVKEDQTRERHWHETSGLVGYLITESQPLFLPIGDRAFRAAHGIPFHGRPCKCWLGVPLRVGDKTVGAIVVHSHERENAYTEQDWRLLAAVADQVAGAIQTANLAAWEADSARQLNVLHQASLELTALAAENEEWLWHAALTVATANYGLGFNRAALFLAEQGGPRLAGRMGIGHFNREEARRAWEQDVEQKLDLPGYLQMLRSNQLQPTPMEHAVHGCPLGLGQDETAFRQVLQGGSRIVVPAAEAAQRLPSPFVEHFGVADYAVMPVRAGEETLGLVVVDNIHDGKPLHKARLDRLETMLAQAALACVNRRQGEVREKLLDANYAITAEMGEQPLGESLTRVCQAAQAVTGADRVLIYSLKAGVEPYEYDNVGSAGQRTDLDLNGKPRQQGVTAHILRAGTMVVPDVASHPQLYGSQKLAEHPILRQEGVQAFAGIPVADVATGEPLGVLYLDYRSPHQFKESEISLARLFANLAAVAIRNARAGQQVRDSLDAARSHDQASERELVILRRVLEEALAADTDEERVVRALLTNAHDLISRTDVRVGLLLRGWRRPAAPEEEPREVRREYFLNPDGTLLPPHIEPDIGRGISGKALQTGESQLRPNVHEGNWEKLYYGDSTQGNTQSELDVPVKLGQQVIGVVHVGSSQRDAFSEAHKVALERLAAGAALALDNVRRQEHLWRVLQATHAVTAPADLKATLQGIRDAAQSAAPSLSALATWYRDPEDGRIRLGSYFGAKDKDAIEREEPSEDGIVQRVMRATKPIWASSAKEDPRVMGRFGGFVTKEAIESTAAFPLRAGGEVIGAMFFNYRQRHEFTSEERVLFPILADVTAASVRQAMLLEQTQQEKRRLAAAQEITEAVGTTLNLDETLRKIMARLQGLFPLAVPCVLLYNEPEHLLEFAPASLAFYYVDNPDLQGQTHLKVNGPGIVCRVARRCLAEGRPAIVNASDARNDPDYLPHIQSTRSAIYVGLMSDKRLLGVLAMESSQKAFDPDDERLVRSVAQQIGLAIDRAEQGAQLRFETTVAATTAWAADIAHDINREVFYIRNRAYWLREEAGLSAEGRQYTQEIDESAGRLVGTVRNARPGERPALREEPLDEFLAKWVRHGVKPRASDISLHLELGCAGLHVLMYPENLQRAVRHLVRNGLEAMPESGTLTVRSRRISDKMVEAQIEDTGLGVPDRVRQIIFREPVSTKRPSRGFGLLFVRSVFEKMGGSVRLLPRETGRGAVFAFRLVIAPVNGEEVSDAASRS